MLKFANTITRFFCLFQAAAARPLIRLRSSILFAQQCRPLICCLSSVRHFVRRLLTIAQRCSGRFNRREHHAASFDYFLILCYTFKAFVFSRMYSMHIYEAHSMNLFELLSSFFELLTNLFILFLKFQIIWLIVALKVHHFLIRSSYLEP